MLVIEGQHIAQMPDTPELPVQVLSGERPHGQVGFYAERGVVRLAGQVHPGDAPFHQKCIQCGIRPVCLGLEDPFHRAVLQILHSHAGGEVVGMGMGEQQVVHPGKEAFSLQHLLPGHVRQVAEGMSFRAVDAVHQHLGPPVFQQHSRVADQRHPQLFVRTFPLIM